MHAADLDRAEFGPQRCINSARANHPRHAAERLADHQDAEMGLAATALNTHMTSVVRAVVGHTQYLGRERGVERRGNSTGPV